MHELEERRWRFYTLFTVIAVFILILIFRLFYLQVIQNSYYSSLAKKEHWREETIPAQRGTIYDTNGHVLATSVGFESLYAITNQIARPEKLARALSPVLGESETEIAAKLATKQNAPTLVKAYLPEEQADAVRKLNLWDVYFQPEFKRMYPEGSIAAQVLGIVGLESQGLTGIEARYNDVLAGKPGSLLAERDATDDEIALSASTYSQPHNGGSITLTIDRYIQKLVEQELEKAVGQYKAAGGTIVVMEPRTGAILAMANRPTIDFNDPNLFAASRTPMYKNAAVSDAWEPGSIFKIITMAAGLDTKAVTPDTSFNNTGSFAYGGGVVRNVITRLGPETMTQTLQRSSNIGAAFASTRMGADAFYRYVEAFGFGQPTGIELQGESPGILRTNKTGNWYPFDLATNAFGQGISVTPIQMVTAVSAAINGGILMKPYVVKEVVTEKERREYHPTVIRQVISPQTSKTLGGMLVSVVELVEGGQVRLAKVPGYHVGGKTGTAEIPTKEGYGSSATIASFVGFGPADDPRFVMLVKIDRPEASPWGETVASPVFRAIAEQLFTYMKVPPATAVTQNQGG